MNPTAMQCPTPMPLMHAKALLLQPSVPSAGLSWSVKAGARNVARTFTNAFACFGSDGHPALLVKAFSFPQFPEGEVGPDDRVLELVVLLLAHLDLLLCDGELRLAPVFPEFLFGLSANGALVGSSEGGVVLQVPGELAAQGTWLHGAFPCDVASICCMV